MNLKKNGKVFTGKFVGTGPSSYAKKNLPGRGLTKVEKRCSNSTSAVKGIPPCYLSGMFIAMFIKTRLLSLSPNLTKPLHIHFQFLRSLQRNSLRPRHRVTFHNILYFNAVRIR